jgi:hypothetical protein
MLRRGGSMAKKNNDYSARAKKAWATKRRNSKAKAKKITKKTVAKKAKKTLTIPYGTKVDEFSFSRNSFTRSQLEELGLVAVLEDGDKDKFRFATFNGLPVLKDNLAFIKRRK